MALVADGPDKGIFCVIADVINSNRLVVLYICGRVSDYVMCKCVLWLPVCVLDGVILSTLTRVVCPGNGGQQNLNNRLIY